MSRVYKAEKLLPDAERRTRGGTDSALPAGQPNDITR